MLSGISAAWVSLSEIPLENQQSPSCGFAGALVTAEDAQAMVQCLPPSSLPEPGFVLPCSVLSANLSGLAALRQALCVCAQAAIDLGSTDADSQGRGCQQHPWLGTVQGTVSPREKWAT